MSSEPLLSSIIHTIEIQRDICETYKTETELSQHNKREHGIADLLSVPTQLEKLFPLVRVVKSKQIPA
jgi:hypothetical protein